jgi:SOS response regulatory protein OraA/RecX
LERLRRSDALEAEIRASLERNGFESAIVERVVAYLRERRLINDIKTIDNLVVTKTGKRAAGIEKLRSELVRRGAPEELIEERLAQVSADSQAEGMRSVLAARFKQTDSRAKGARLLLSRGFSEDEIGSALDEFFGPEEDF